MYKIARDRAKERYANKLALLRLKECGYVRERKQHDQVSFFITKEGKSALHNLYAHTSIAAKKPTWDGKWRVVAYDFPESERSLRNSLRYILTKARFLQIQKSVWISPYDSSILSELLVKHDIVHKHTIFLTTDTLASTKDCKKHFGLK
jgi:phenylacetic acid degradation operon negative regulatory protein